MFSESLVAKITNLWYQILAIKVFAVRVNSMPEERTVSALTWITPPARSLMGLVQMTARTKVRQHYAMETKVRVILLIFDWYGSSSNLLFKARKNSTPRPTVKFYDVKSKIFSKTSLKGSKLPDDDEDDSWLDEESERHDSVQVLDAETTSPINPASKYLATFLAEEEEKSTADVLPDEGKKVNNIQAPTKVGEDNDFSMDFD